MATYVKPLSIANLSFLDNSNENSSVQTYVSQVTALNFAAMMVELEALWAAIRGVSLCNPETSQVTTAISAYNMGVPASKLAQREIALKVGFTDTVNQKKGHITIPGADWAAIGGNGNDVNYANLQWVALKAALETTAKSVDGNPITVVYGKFIGRRS